MSDITQRRRMEEELLKVQKLESVGVLAGGIAHDFNNILTAVLGSISLARMYDDPGEKDESLSEAESACLQARDLTQQLLTFSRGGAPIRKTTSIAELLRDSAIFALRGSNVRRDFIMPEDLWPVEIHQGQMSQVINNIVINADQAMPDGGIVRICGENVAIGADSDLPLQAGAYIRVSIDDDGVGIPQEYLGQVFDPYFTTKQGGSGLGLAAAYSIVKKHDGHIVAESEVGVGTAFRIYLPASPQEAPRVKEEGKVRPITAGGRALVMDDEENVRDTTSQMLSRIGYETTTAADGAEALALYGEAMESGNPFDAVILDLTVRGGMGGRAAIGKLIALDPTVKAIVSSGYSHDPIMADFREYGFRDVLAKPYNMEDLSRTLHRMMTQSA